MNLSDPELAAADTFDLFVHIDGWEIGLVRGNQADAAEFMRRLVERIAALENAKATPPGRAP